MNLSQSKTGSSFNFCNREHDNAPTVGVIAGNYGQFHSFVMDQCYKENADVRGRYVYLNNPRTLRGLKLEKIEKVGTWESRLDIHQLLRAAELTTVRKSPHGEPRVFIIEYEGWSGWELKEFAGAGDALNYISKRIAADPEGVIRRLGAGDMKVIAGKSLKFGVEVEVKGLTVGE